MKEKIMNLEKEKRELTMKIHKEKNFRLTEEFDELNSAEKCLLDAQIGIMEAYSEILLDRIILMHDRESFETDNKLCDAIKDFIETVEKIVEGEE